MLANVKADNSEGRLDVEWYVPGSPLQSKEDCQKRSMYEIWNPSRPLYLETNVSGVILGDALLQMMDGMSCGCDEVQDNAAWCLIAFASKSLLTH